MYLNGITIDTASFPRTDCYPFDLAVLRGTTSLGFSAPVTLFLGENGSGKSTLLEAIARRCHIHIWTRSKRHIAHKNPHETDL
jgi:predicted ATPase